MSSSEVRWALAGPAMKIGNSNNAAQRLRESLPTPSLPHRTSFLLRPIVLYADVRNNQITGIDLALLATMSALPVDGLTQGRPNKRGAAAALRRLLASILDGP